MSLRGSLALWLCGYVAMWLCGHVAMWLCGDVAMRPCGYVTLWLCRYSELCANAPFGGLLAISQSDVFVFVLRLWGKGVSEHPVDWELVLFRS